MVKQTNFNKAWLEIPEFQRWFAEAKTVGEAQCTLCKTMFSLSNMGVQALHSHSKSRKHIQRQNATKSTHPLSLLMNAVPGSTGAASGLARADSKSGDAVLRSANSTGTGTTQPQEPVATSVISSTAISQTAQRVETRPPSIQSFVVIDDVTKAEILWALESVYTHKSLRSAASDVKLFPLFPDSKIIEKMTLLKDKLSYLISHGLAYYFRDQLKSVLLECPELSFGFDESLNKVAVNQQMDISVRFWDQKTNEVLTRYLDSVFLGKTTAVDLLKAFLSVVRPFGLAKMENVSLNGPNVNMLFMKELKILKEEGIDHELLDVGTCGLHTVHGSVKTGFKATGWKIVEFLRALYNLIRCSPARRATYQRLTQPKPDEDELIESEHQSQAVNSL